MNTIKIIFTGTVVALLAGFAIFQFEKNELLEQRGESMMRGFGLLTKVFSEGNEALLQDSSFHCLAAIEYDGTQIALFTSGGRLSRSSADWDHRDDSFVSHHISSGRAGERLLVSGSEMSDSQYVFSMYPLPGQGERASCIVLKERVADVRAYLWRGLGKITMASVVIGLAVSVSGILLRTSLRTGRSSG